jgi:hypothetical protein
MNNDLKVYTETVIEDTPFPQETQSFSSVTTSPSSSNGQTYSETKIQLQEYPLPKFANELIGQALNTRARNILQEFTFTRSGAIQIGEYREGVSGDIRMSPSGIVMRNILGENTLVADGDRGDITVKGTIRASTFESNNLLTGQIDVGQGSGNSFVRIDGANNRIVVHDGTNPRIVIGNV